MWGDWGFPIGFLWGLFCYWIVLKVKDDTECEESAPLPLHQLPTAKMKSPRPRIVAKTDEGEAEVEQKRRQEKGWDAESPL